MWLLKDTGAMDSPFFFVSKHFIGAFMVFCPIHQRTERGKKGKRTPSTCLACNNFFDDGSIKWKRCLDPLDPKQKKPALRGECSGCTERFISRHVLREKIRAVLMNLCDAGLLSTMNLKTDENFFVSEKDSLKFA